MITSIVTSTRPPATITNQEQAGFAFPLRLEPGGPTQLLRIPLPDDGRPDAPRILPYINQVTDQVGGSPWLREFTVSILPPYTGNNDLVTILGTIASFVRDRMRYVPDPDGTELFIDPIGLIERIQTNGFAWGDCDDHVALLNAMARSVGFETRAAAVHLNDPDLWDHVISQVKIFGQWVDLDPCVKSAETPFYREKLV